MLWRKAIREIAKNIGKTYGNREKWMGKERTADSERGAALTLAGMGLDSSGGQVGKGLLGILMAS
jgi:hypothetical protein